MVMYVSTSMGRAHYLLLAFVYASKCWCVFASFFLVFVMLLFMEMGSRGFISLSFLSTLPASPPNGGCNEDGASRQLCTVVNVAIKL